MLDILINFIKGQKIEQLFWWPQLTYLKNHQLYYLLNDLLICINWIVIYDKLFVTVCILKIIHVYLFDNLRESSNNHGWESNICTLLAWYAPTSIGLKVKPKASIYLDLTYLPFVTDGGIAFRSWNLCSVFNFFNSKKVIFHRIYLKINYLLSEFHPNPFDSFFVHLLIHRSKYSRL